MNGDPPDMLEQMETGREVIKVIEIIVRELLECISLARAGLSPWITAGCDRRWTFMIRDDCFGYFASARWANHCVPVVQMSMEGHRVAGVTEALLLLSPEVAVTEGRWRLAEQAARAILAAIERYASASGEGLRAAASLADLPATNTLRRKTLRRPSRPAAVDLNCSRTS